MNVAAHNDKMLKNTEQTSNKIKTKKMGAAAADVLVTKVKALFERRQRFCSF